jgi:hypothetical protein
MAKHNPDLIFCRKQPGISVGKLCDKCDGKVRRAFHSLARLRAASRLRNSHCLAHDAQTLNALSALVRRASFNRH